MPAPLPTRRAFLTGQLSVEDIVVYPPGATPVSIVNCSGCGTCADLCPTSIIVMQSGKPIVDFSRGECTFCGRCAERCPERVFPPEPAARFSHVAAIEDGCLAINYVDCQACRDACPAEAIRFRPRLGGPFVPSLVSEACTGCGACMSVCPAGSISMHPMEAAHG